MSLLKLSALTISGITLWLAPSAILSRKVPMHGLVQGIALVSSFACCFEARRTAIALAKAEDFEAMEQRAITGDAEDELATSVYVAEQQRRHEAEAILSGQPEREESVEALKRAWLLDCGEPSDPTAQPLNPLDSRALVIDDERFTSLNLTRQQALELVKKLRTELNQTQVIEKLWECKKGGSDAWKRAHAQFKNLMGEGE